MALIKVDVCIDHSMRALCLHSYPGHPKGCPNFGRREECPPQVKTFEKLFDISKDTYAIVNEFDLKSHVDKMEKMHPGWSYRMLSCLLYWQPSARKQMRKLIASTKVPKGYLIIGVPEAMGINITTTLASAGIDLEWPPIHIVRQVVLVAYPIGGNKKWET